MSGPLPGSPEWLRFMTASKISAVVGTSPYESRFSLWHRMHGDIGPQGVNPQMTVGNVLEPALIAWFAAQHPETEVLPGAWVVHESVEWAAATPDGFAGDDLLEVKTARDAWEWSDESVPAGYRDQCQWQMWVTGARVVHVAALVAMELVERTVAYDAERVEFLAAAAEQFMASLAANQAPDIDGSTFTYQAIREMHPEIDDVEVEIPDDLAREWLEARHWATTQADQEAALRNQIADLMGTARRATWQGRPIFNRQARGNGTPYLVVARNLPPIGVAA